MVWGNRLQALEAQIEHQTYETEKHLHGREIWFGDAADPSAGVHEADIESPTAFIVNAGNNDWGTALQILGSADTPTDPLKNKYDPHMFLFVAAGNNAQVYYFRVIEGATAEAGVTAGKYSNIMMVSGVGTFTGRPVPVMMPRADVGAKLWIQSFAPTQNTSTASFYFGIHEYDR